MHQWNDVVAVLERQHGVISRAQLDLVGVGARQVQRLVSARRLERRAPRVWRVTGSPSTWYQQLMVGLLSLGDGAAVSHRAAAQLHGLDRAVGDHVEFLVTRRERNTRINAEVHSSTTLRRTDVVTVAGLRTTSATRTILDLANLPIIKANLAAAIDSAVRLQLSAPEAIRIRLQEVRQRGRTGVVLLDRLLEDSGGHSPLERAFLTLMRQAELPRPEMHVVFKAGARTLARVDFLFREWNIVVEVSGQQGHASPTERARDAHRRNELQDLGLRVYEFTYHDVTERPVWVAYQMRLRLQSAGWPHHPVPVTKQPA